MRAAPPMLRAWVALARNDLRGTYRDPLLVMLVVAPAIWTVATMLVVPPLTGALARRHHFDLVSYYPLVVTALLMLTSILITGALAAFLVLDEVDAGTLSAVRVTPVSLSTVLGYRAATVMAVTSVYVVLTMVASGLVAPGLILPLLPIALVAGSSAVITLLLIVAVARNKVQGIAMVRLLGIVFAGLPCLAWFVDSGWNLAFGVLPPYWPAKAYWAASAHATWWTYLLGGVAYHLVIGRLLLRQTLTTSTTGLP